jgi:hypothetical protein
LFSAIPDGKPVTIFLGNVLKSGPDRYGDFVRVQACAFGLDIADPEVQREGLPANAAPLIWPCLERQFEGPSVQIDVVLDPPFLIGRLHDQHAAIERFDFQQEAPVGPRLDDDPAAVAPGEFPEIDRCRNARAGDIDAEMIFDAAD